MSGIKYRLNFLFYIFLSFFVFFKIYVELWECATFLFDCLQSLSVMSFLPSDICKFAFLFFFVLPCLLDFEM